MSSLTVVVFLVTMFIMAQHGLAVRNVTTTDSLEIQADGREQIMNSSQQETVRFPRHTRTRYWHWGPGHRRAEMTKYIINGSPASPGQFPYQVSVHHTDSSFIGTGAIITAFHVLTSARYFCEAHGKRAIPPHELVVHTGTAVFAQDPSAYDVADTVCHEQYHPPRHTAHHLALIRVTKHFDYSDTLNIIELSTAHYQPGLAVTISGWGSTTEKKHDGWNPQLHYGDTTTLTFKKCRRLTKGSARARGFFQPDVTGCVISPADGPYAAGWGDAGAPVVHDGRLVGVVAWNFRSSQVTGFVSVVHHLEWITQNVAPKV